MHANLNTLANVDRNTWQGRLTWKSCSRSCCAKESGFPVAGENQDQRNRRIDILVEKTGAVAGEGVVRVADGRRAGGGEGMEGEEGGMEAAVGGGIRVAAGAGGGGDREEGTKKIDDGCSREV